MVVSRTYPRKVREKTKKNVTLFFFGRRDRNKGRSQAFEEKAWLENLRRLSSCLASSNEGQLRHPEIMARYWPCTFLKNMCSAWNASLYPNQTTFNAKVNKAFTFYNVKKTAPSDNMLQTMATILVSIKKGFASHNRVCLTGKELLWGRQQGTLERNMIDVQEEKETLLLGSIHRRSTLPRSERALRSRAVNKWMSCMGDRRANPISQSWDSRRATSFFVSEDPASFEEDLRCLHNSLLFWGADF